VKIYVPMFLCGSVNNLKIPGLAVDSGLSPTAKAFGDGTWALDCIRSISAEFFVKLNGEQQ
jgi:hypothetical protein